MVHAFFDTGITRTIFQVPLVDLPNPNGMVALDRQVYMPSPESGSFFLWDAADGPTGDRTGENEPNCQMKMNQNASII